VARRRADHMAKFGRVEWICHLCKITSLWAVSCIGHLYLKQGLFGTDIDCRSHDNSVGIYLYSLY
jgi:hypothetical protein